MSLLTSNPQRGNLMARTRNNTTVEETADTRTVYEVSTISTLRYEKENGRGGFTFTVPPYAVRKLDGKITVKVYAEAHESFISRNLGNNDFVIREIELDTSNYRNTTPDSKWRKLPDNVKFLRKDNTEITLPNLNDLGLEEVEI